MYKYFRKTGFILAFLFFGLIASGQNNIARWGGTVTINNLDIFEGSPAGLVDGDYLTYNFFSVNGAAPWIQYQSPKAVVLTSYAVTVDLLDFGYAPTGWTFSGSNDGTNWTVLDTQTSPSFSADEVPQIFPLTGNATAYSYYRLNLPGSDMYLMIDELDFFTSSPPPPPVISGNAFSGTEAGIAWTITGPYDSSYLERSIDNTNFYLVNSFGSGLTAYTDQTLSPSTPFYYRLRVKFPDGTFQYSNIMQVTTNALSGQSADITNDGGSLYVSAENSNGATSPEGSAHFTDNDLTTKWLVFSSQAPGDLAAIYKPTGSYVVTGYSLGTANDSPPRDPKSWTFSGSNDSTSWITLDSRTNQLGNNAPRLTNFTYVVLNPGTVAYKYYRILFTDDNGASDGVRYQIAEWQIFGIDPTAPAIPVSLAVTNSAVTSIALSWSETVTNPVSGFRLQRSTNGIDYTTIDSLPAAASIYTDKSVYDSTSYYYRIQALGSKSAAISGWSNVASATTGYVAGQPLTPIQLSTSFAIDSVVGLGWVDRSYNETGFRLERSADGINFVPIDTLAADTVSFNDSANLWPATKYYYRVAAFNAQGISGYSNIDSVTTPGFNNPPVLTLLPADQYICSNGAEYSFSIGGLVAGPHNELSQQLFVTNVSADAANANFFSSFSFVPAVNSGVATIMVKGAGTGAYSDTAVVLVTVKDNGGTTFFGTDSLQFPIRLVYKPLSVNISADRDTTYIPKYAIVGLTANTNFPSTTPNYTWDDAPGIEGSRNNIILNVSPLATTVYKVTATSVTGCTATAQVTLSPEAGRTISNVLTPNGDGKNDRWIVWNITENQRNSVKVFDRAGRMVFYKQNYSNDWDGTYNGKPLDEGAYYYVVDYGEGQKPVTGMLTIIRDHK